ncbi:Riboflavin biosynthesis protein RibD [Planctomycetes bacterium Pla163]|uniref:Riboflavin biosynthesis protein RibD n=2 Tax=Rohdeia mirabilis TaxID=2528008 RepID=A0A518D192_9BACT|nr:Riboflavin biosynthesis protein RibD [Planctomycetes bacterium Pla163]
MILTPITPDRSRRVACAADMPSTVASIPRGRMAQILAEVGERARAARFEIAPNPAVGAALVAADGSILAEGRHLVYGGPHAEIEALRAYRATGRPMADVHTLAITLEPCSTTGKTPACTDAIIKSGIKRVAIADLDPDPRHRGRALAILGEHGIEVETHPGAAPLSVVSPHFESYTSYERLRRPRPWLIAKWAQTRSGHLSPPEDVGEGRWISSPESLREVQLLRSHVDAIVTGVGTVVADDPRLTVRFPAGLDRPPLRVVLDTELRTPPDARIFRPAERGEAGGPVYILCRAGANGVRHRELLAAGARVHPLRPGADGRVHLRESLEWMWRFGVRRALLETGPTLLSSYFEAGFVDQVRIYTGNVNGGRGDSLATLLAGTKLLERSDREVGPDAVLEAFVGRSSR